MNPRILVFAGSNRTGSVNGKLAAAGAVALAKAGAEVTHVSLADYDMPIFDEDLEKADGIPSNAIRLGKMIAEHDGLMIVSPEYNASVSPLLKNTIDWVSRISKIDGRAVKPFQGKIAALCSVSPGALGGIRGLYHLRAIAMNVGMTIITEQCAVPNASQAFNEDGSLAQERGQTMLQGTIDALISTCRGHSHNYRA
jgi:chromate reductase, NAD(P)H dehydrogenase (quinone)